jgi:GNAT superfamily N-acetyltransferase
MSLAVPVEVKPVQSWWQRRQFLNLPWQIQGKDPNWVPPLRMNQKELVGYKHHPFYDYAKAQTFLAYKDGKPVGRISAIVNPRHNARHQEKRGFLGFFECIDDLATAKALFDAGKAWLKEQGMTSCRGPVNPSMNYELGLLIDGFDTPPTFMMTHNPPCYQRLWEENGFAKTQDMVAFWGHIDMLTQVDGKLYEMTDACRERFNVQIRRLDRKRFNEDVRLFLDLYNLSLQGTWGVVEMSEGEIDHLAESLKMLIVPEMTTVAEIDGQVVGATFALLDYNPRIKQIDGRLFPFGFIRLLWNKRKIKKIRVISTNVIPEWQKWGVGLVIVGYLLPSVQDWGIQEAEFSYVLESNKLSYGTLKRGGAKIVKTYRLYDQDIA